MKVHDVEDTEICPHCGSDGNTYDFSNSEEKLEREVEKVKEERKENGLEGLVGDLEAVIINTEIDKHKAAVEEYLRYTGLEHEISFENKGSTTSVLRTRGSADFLITSRKEDDNPFIDLNDRPKSKHLPNTRLETLVFACDDLQEYVQIQKERGVNFMTNSIQETKNHRFIQTIPSTYTGNSLGFIEWKGGERNYASEKDEVLDWNFQKPDKEYLSNIKELDHAATRVRAKDRDAAIIEFMELTNYDFDFAIYVETFNSITNVARLTKDDYAMVFTSGVIPYESDEESGPTEKFIHNYGTRVHHTAFRTENIEETFEAIKEDGMDFLIELVGSPEDGLKQTFTTASENTLLVNEYIHRYGDFDGFFTRSNVTKLTEATKKQ